MNKAITSPIAHPKRFRRRRQFIALSIAVALLLGMGVASIVKIDTYNVGSGVITHQYECLGIGVCSTQEQSMIAGELRRLGLSHSGISLLLRRSAIIHVGEEHINSYSIRYLSNCNGLYEAFTIFNVSDALRAEILSEAQSRAGDREGIADLIDRVQRQSDVP